MEFDVDMFTLQA